MCLFIVVCFSKTPPLFAYFMGNIGCHIHKYKMKILLSHTEQPLKNKYSVTGQQSFNYSSTYDCLKMFIDIIV